MRSSSYREVTMNRRSGNSGFFAVLSWCSLFGALVASEASGPTNTATTSSRSLGSSSSTAAAAASLDYFPVPAFRMIFQSTEISAYSYLTADLSSELQTNLQNYLLTYFSKNRYSQSIPAPLKMLNNFQLQVRDPKIVPFTPPGSRRTRRRLGFGAHEPTQQRQQQQLRHRRHAQEVQQVLSAEFHGNASFYRTASSTTSASSNQTAIRLMEAMLNQFFELAMSPIQLQLLQKELIFLSVDPILMACSNITVELDIEHVLTEVAAPTTNNNNSDASSTLSTIHALIITLVLFCVATFILFLFLLARRRDKQRRNLILSQHYNMGGNDEIYDHSARSGGGLNAVHTPTSMVLDSQSAHHSPEVFKILEESDRYLSKHRPDLFRALQSTNNTTNNPHQSFVSKNPFTYLYQTYWAKESPPPPTSRARSASNYRKRSSFHLPDGDTRIIKASGSIDHEDPRIANIHNNGSDPNALATAAAAAAAAASTSSRSWDGTGFTPISTWVRWATGGWTGKDSFYDHHRGGGGDGNKTPTSATGSLSPTSLAPPPFQLTEINLNDEEEDEDLYQSGRDGVFRFDMNSSLACDEDPTNYPFVYRDFPRHDGTPCLIFEIGDDDDDDDEAGALMNKDEVDEKDVFGSWKSLLKRNNISKPDLLAYFSSSSNNLNADNNNGSTQDERKSLAKGPNGVDVVSDDDLHRMLEQHAMDQYISRSQRKNNAAAAVGSLPTDPDSEEDFKPHLERLLASRFRQYEKRSILERHREARQKERDEAAAAIALARSHQSDDDDDEDDDDGNAYDDDEDDDDEEDDYEDEDDYDEEPPPRVHRRASQRQLDMERDISALEDSISPRSVRVPRKSCPAPPPAAAPAPSAPAYNPWTSTSSFGSSVYVPPPPASSPYVPPPPASSPYVPPPAPVGFDEKSKSGGSVASVRSVASARSTPAKTVQSMVDHRVKTTGRDDRAPVEFTLDFAGNTAPPKVEESAKDFDLKKFRDAYKDFNAPSMDELFSSNATLDIAKLRAAFASSNAPSMDELREIPVPQENLDEFLQKGLTALDNSSKRSSSNSVVDDVNSAARKVFDSTFDRDPIPPPPPPKFSTPSGRRRRKDKHERSLSDTKFDWGAPQRSSSTHTHRSDNGDISHTTTTTSRHPQQTHKHHKRTASYTEEAMLRGDMAHQQQQQQQQHKRTPSFTEDVMVHGIYAQIRHDKFSFDNDEKMMH